MGDKLSQTRHLDPNDGGDLLVAPQVVMDRTLANRTSSGDLPLPQLEDFLDLTHGHSPSWHSVSPVRYIGETVCPV